MSISVHCTLNMYIVQYLTIFLDQFFFVRKSQICTEQKNVGYWVAVGVSVWDPEKLGTVNFLNKNKSGLGFKSERIFRPFSNQF